MGNRIREKSKPPFLDSKLRIFIIFKNIDQKVIVNNKVSLNYNMFCLKRSLEAAS